MSDLPTLDGPRVLPASGGDPKQLVILLHGLGSSGRDLIEFAPYWRSAAPDAVFVAPNAPEPHPGVPGGYRWWDVVTFSLEERAEGTRAAAPILDAFIDAELARYGLDDRNLVLVGFSQGTMMALQVAARRDQPIGGVMAFSGMVTEPARLGAELKSRPPVLLVHGARDQMIPLHFFFEAKGALEALGFDLTHHVSSGLEHAIDGAGIKLGENFLKRVFA